MQSVHVLNVFHEAIVSLIYYTKEMAEERRNDFRCRVPFWYSAMPHSVLCANLPINSQEEELLSYKKVFKHSS